MFSSLPLSSAQLRRILEEARVGVGFVPVGATGPAPFATVNRALCELLGYTKQELLELSPRDITHPRDQA